MDLQCFIEELLDLPELEEQIDYVGLTQQPKHRGKNQHQHQLPGDVGGTLIIRVDGIGKCHLYILQCINYKINVIYTYLITWQYILRLLNYY